MSIGVSSTSRFAIIGWVNDTLLLPLTKIEQLGSGSVYCQLLDAAYPERVPLHKVKWDAKLEVDFLHNFKILVTSFEFLGIEKKIDIQKLAKTKYQDNLQFVQWLKTFIEDKIDYENYEPLKRRNFAKINLSFANKPKLNVTMNNANKQNSESFMKSSIKSNATMRSMGMVSSRSSASILTASNLNTGNLKTLPDRDPIKHDKHIRPLDKRKAVGPITMVSLQNKNLAKNQSCANITTISQSRQFVKNVDVIESQGSEDEFF